MKILKILEALFIFTLFIAISLIYLYTNKNMPNSCDNNKIVEIVNSVLDRESIKLSNVFNSSKSTEFLIKDIKDSGVDEDNIRKCLYSIDYKVDGKIVKSLDINASIKKERGDNQVTLYLYN